MAWVKLDHYFADHPKLVKVGPLGSILQVRALCWSVRHKTDGFIPTEAMATLLAGFEKLGMRDTRRGNFVRAVDVQWAELMVEARLWESTAGGYVIHDFSTYNSAKKPSTSSPSPDAHIFTVPPTATTTTPTPTPPQESTSSVSVSRPAGPSRRTMASETWKTAEWGSAASLAALWNEMAPDNLPTVETLSRGRFGKIDALLKQFPDRDWWVEVMQQYQASRFLSGRRPPGKGYENFKPDFDWLISKAKDHVTENAVKVHDGAYHG